MQNYTSVLETLGEGYVMVAVVTLWGRRAVVNKRRLVCSNAGSGCTYIAAALYVIHATHRLYEGLRISIFSDLGIVGPITFLSDLAFPIAAGLTLVAHSPDFQLQTGAR